MLVENKTRSLVKVFSWRITATLTTTIITFLITGSTSFAVKVGAFEVVAKLILHYIHERVWNRIPFGLQKQMDYQI